MAERVARLEVKVDKIQEDLQETRKHISVLNDEMGQVNIKIHVMKQELGWNTKLSYFILTSIMGLFIAAYFNVI